MQPLNAMAVRPPANTSAAAAPAPAAPEPITAESLGWQLRAALPPLRLHSVSLYDAQANVLWLSEGALGPDEHNLVLEALDTLGNDRSLPCYENGLEDGRVAIFLPVRAPQGDLVGIAMILADMKSINDGVLEKIVSPQARTIMQKIAVLLRANAKASNAEPAAPIEVNVASVLELAPERAARNATPNPPAAHSQPARTQSPPRATGSVGPVMAPAPAKPAANAKADPSAANGSAELSPQAVDDILEFELLLPDVAAAIAPVALPPSSASDLQPTSPLSWDNTDAGLELMPELVPGMPLSAQVPTVSPPKPVASPIPDAPAALTVPTPPPAADSSGAAANDSLSTTAVSLALVTNPTAAAAAPAASQVPAPQPPSVSALAPAAVKSTNATTTTKTLSPTGTGRPLNGSATTATVPTLNATGTSRTLALDPASLLLDIQPFSKLRPGGRTRRYEVLPRIPSRDGNRVPAAMDGLALQRLLSWLGANRAAWNLEPTSFSLNLSISTLEDTRFPQYVASCLKTNGIAPDNLGFEIAEALCTQHRAQVERFISLCDKLGCFVVIDDFSFDSAVLPLLRSKALRLVKIDPKLTSVALRDKLSQAVVVAIVQAVKVLGIHCAAKRVESQASLQWLTAIGCDLAQGPALSQVLPIESLTMPQAPATEPGKAT